MKAIDNTQNIKRITLKRSVVPFCPIGQASYKADVTVVFLPRGGYMEYCEFTEFIDGFTGKEATVEDLAGGILQVAKEYDPQSVIVEVEAFSPKHLPVKVSAEYYADSK